MKNTGKHTEQEVLSRYLEVFGKHKKCLVSGIMLFVLAFPFVSLWIMKVAAMVKGDCLSVPDNVSSWFGYSASYLGAVASMGIGLLTIELTLMLERINENEQQKQQEYSVATHMPDLTCKKGTLYDCNEDIPSRCLDKLSFWGGYVLELHLTPAFPIYFDIKIIGIGFRWRTSYVENNELKMEDKECHIELNREDYDFANNRDFELTIHFTVENENQTIIRNFYESYLRFSHDTNYKDNLIEVMVQMECQNVLLSSKEGIGDIPFELCLTMKNVGKDENGISLETVNRKIRR